LLYKNCNILPVSHNKAIARAKDEYKKYQVKTISPVEKRVFKDFKSNK